MDASQFATKDLDHLGLAAGMCHRIGLIERIDEMVPDTGRDVSVGQATQAMVLNGLGFVGRALYLSPEFWEAKSVERLIGEGVRAEQLNEHSLGRALDHLYEAGVTEVFAHVAAHALAEMGIATSTIHLDSTSFGLHGAYEFAPSEQAEMIEVRHGYSRDHRPDLKQVVLSMICTHEGALPLWIEALSGNTADSSSFKETVSAYIEQLSDEEQTPYIVADTALYTASTIQDLGDEVTWVTRVPASIALVKALYDQVNPHPAEGEEPEMRPVDETYQVYPLGSTYGGVNQRWLLVFSQALYDRQVKTLDKRVAKQREEAEKQLRRLMRADYQTKEAAQAAVEAVAAEWRYHTADITAFEPVPRYNKPGRPARDQQPDYYVWTIQAHVLDNERAIAEARGRKGFFVLATNELDTDRLPDEELIAVYKGQNTTVERGFRFLKDPLFFADSFFLNKPSRIMALLMIMGLCLLIYSLAEHLLRSQLVAQNETVPDQKGRPTQRITMRRVFQMFEGIHVLTVDLPTGSEQFVTNLHDVHRQILRLLGPTFEKCYLPDP